MPDTSFCLLRYHARLIECFCQSRNISFLRKAVCTLYYILHCVDLPVLNPSYDSDRTLWASKNNVVYWLTTTTKPVAIVPQKCLNDR